MPSPPTPETPLPVPRVRRAKRLLFAWQLYALCSMMLIPLLFVAGPRLPRVVILCVACVVVLVAMWLRGPISQLDLPHLLQKCHAVGVGGMFWYGIVVGTVCVALGLTSAGLPGMTPAGICAIVGAITSRIIMHRLAKSFDAEQQLT